MAYTTARPSKSLGLSRTSIYSLFSLLALFFLSTLAACGSAASTGDKYLIGVGKADITGPVVEIGFAGYANLDQVGSGLRQRLHSRAFIIADKNNPKDRFVYLVLDTQSGDTATRYGVLEGLKKLGSDYDVYGHNNLALTGTHSHAGPGAWFNYLLPQVTSLGFDKQSYQALVDGAVLSIKRAHENLQEGYLDTGTTRIKDGAINRSLFAYLANPESERKQYEDQTDTLMTLLRFKRASDNKDIGVLTWYPVHGTSLLGNNTHAAADNKGVAAWMFENAMKENSNAADGFVAGFSQANVGDTTPNVLGAYCDDGSGQQCSLENSTCADGKSQSCHGRGPEFAALDLGVKSCYEMGRRQFAGAQTIYSSLGTSGTAVVGSSVKAFHFFHDMRFWNFTLPNGKQAQTCPAALGYSFAAGTSDWPGAFDFTQGDSGEPNANPLWKLVSGLLRTPTAQQKACQGSKPILLDVGEMDQPYAWTPNIVDIQALRVGQFVIIVSPSEATTMSGLRWKAAVAAEASSFLPQKPIVVLGGPANSYSHYCATPEEYEVQRYEGASTLFGPHELDAYINLTVSNMHYLRPDSKDTPDQGPLAPDNRGKALSFITGVVVDNAPIGSSFGKVVHQPSASYQIGSVVNVTFQGANPRNNLRQEQTFAAVEQQNADGSWTQVRDDTDWFLVYSWRRTNFILGYSEVDISWETYGNAKPGTYRIKYYGDSKPLIGSIKAFQGTSNSFKLTGGLTRQLRVM
ncbi:neutral/alkaline nonlysosomal ceramidase [Pochonia chlamydosporia 170]|uniref:Neutral ceramidase n=1 Tax=Pochonia chlamydosporia 170 TaxID=1380566 RepID=A0A179G7R1_METCM|nr:neutral/alkaline nonlysosomal ceramidase [Pochonia chlamydosporia 170]OAQ73836.1 neutral/alkaline nonlysosomal ceramidase [Pochonia chlamydosporia 170]